MEMQCSCCLPGTQLFATSAILAKQNTSVRLEGKSLTVMSAAVQLLASHSLEAARAKDRADAERAEELQQQQEALVKVRMVYYQPARMCRQTQPSVSCSILRCKIAVVSAAVNWSLPHASAGDC